MKSKLLIIFFFLLSGRLLGQELFVFTEPASNMPAKSIGLRVTNMLMKERFEKGINYHVLPELMWGVNKNMMLHAEGFISNRNSGLLVEGGGLYAKYRMFSKDNVHSHFRVASFGRLSYNSSDVHQQEIETNAHNSGYELGLISTQLINKVALSASASYEGAMDNNSNKFPSTQSNNAVNYTFSVGKLMVPREYVSYKQPNLNFMLEFLGQRTTNENGNGGKYFVDIAPSLQLILNSQSRIDVGYRYELRSNMYRTAPNGFLIRLEHSLFNVL